MPCSSPQPTLPASPLLQSFTLNQLLGVGCEEGFGVGHTRLTQTKGVWMWGEPVPVQLPNGETTHVSWGGWRVGRGSKPCRAAVPAGQGEPLAHTAGQLWGSMRLPVCSPASLGSLFAPLENIHVAAAHTLLLLRPWLPSCCTPSPMLDTPCALLPAAAVHRHRGL